MKKFLTLLMRHWVKTPVKISLTISAVALGTGVLILSFSAGKILDEQVISKMSDNGIIVYAANGEWSTDGSLEMERPSQWDATIFDKLRSDSSDIDSVALVLDKPFEEITANGKSYILRSSVATDINYFEVFSIDIIAGIPMTLEDYESGFKKVWISEEMAVMLFGNAENAIGQKVVPPGRRFQRDNGRSQDLLTQYSVAGIYENPTEVARRSYGISDLIVPVTAILPSGENASRMLDFMSGSLVLKSRASSVEKIDAEISQIVENNFGYDINLVVWEGTPEGESSYMEELRQAISIFTVSVNILGIVLLLTSSLGIFSIMVVEALGRKREIALERSLGASQIRVIKEFWSWSIMLSLLGAVIGIILAFILAKPVLGTMAPLLGELSENFSEASGVKLSSVISGFLLALGCGGILGLLPAFSAVKGNISETLREV
ncbi:MAG: ABC transporter permease [Spirochaetaceae bacterium]|jgi:putative ABC transport system permease protein|nr:ABC transporter permease [Spirochaetaceae bacterium]